MTFKYKKPPPWQVERDRAQSERAVAKIVTRRNKAVRKVLAAILAIDDESMKIETRHDDQIGGVNLVITLGGGEEIWIDIRCASPSTLL